MKKSKPSLCKIFKEVEKVHKYGSIETHCLNSNNKLLKIDIHWLPYIPKKLTKKQIHTEYDV